jgi:hypothetical protein
MNAAVNIVALTNVIAALLSVREAEPIPILFR